MKCLVGDVVAFKIGSNEIEKGEIRFIEKSRNENILYINGFSGWAYKVPERKIVSKKNNSRKND